MENQIDRDGLAVVRGVFTAVEAGELLSALGPITSAGRRGMLAFPVVRELSRSARILQIVHRCLAAEPTPVRAIYFNKSPEANWLVSWHQDVTLAVRARAEAPGFGPWSMKDGIQHVQPPVGLLEQMLAVRLHLDDTDELNGALRVLPGSHRHGRLSQQQIEELRAQSGDYVCSASAGDVLLMRPLILHASSRSIGSGPRRILHIEYAGFGLPAGLDWHEAA
jgi:ectoine hydroxylase-related dioxygenase (phytanoyl-CoA dioxygenase family)